MSAATSPGAVAAHGAFEIDQLGCTVVSKNSLHQNFLQAPNDSVTRMHVNGTPRSYENVSNFPGRNCLVPPHTQGLYKQMTEMEAHHQVRASRESDGRHGAHAGAPATLASNQVRLRDLVVERLHDLRSLHFAREFIAGANHAETLERYGRLPCDRLPRACFVLEGGRR